MGIEKYQINLVPLYIRAVQLQNEDCKVQKPNLTESNFAFFNLHFDFWIKLLHLDNIAYWFNFIDGV